MRKKFLCGALVTAMCLTGLTACGDQAVDTPTEEPTTEEVTTEAAKPDDTATADNANQEDGPGTEDDAGVDGTTLDTTYWSLTYDDTLWTYEEDNLTDSDTRSSIELSIVDGEDTVVTAYIDANITDCRSFRDDLYTYGIDEHDYADGNVDTISIGGVDLMEYEGSYWGSDSIRYFNRFESANETISFRIVGDVDNDAVQPLLDGITFEVKDIGNTDYPWYWDGEPFDFDTATVNVGSYSINSQFLKADEPDISHEVFEHHIAVSGDKVYVLSQDILKVYTTDGSSLTFDQEYTLDKEYDTIDIPSSGKIYLSSMGGLVEWADGSVATTYSDDLDYVALNPSGTYGVSYFVSGDKCKRFDMAADGTISNVTDLNFAECSTVSECICTDNHIFVCGSPSDEEDKGHTIFVYDTNGNYQMSLKADTENIGLGSCTYVWETSDGGFAALDGNMRSIPCWSADGTYQGRADDADLFGTYYPWFCDSCYVDGTVYTVITDERPDKSCDEALVFTLTGF